MEKGAVDTILYGWVYNLSYNIDNSDLKMSFLYVGRSSLS